MKPRARTAAKRGPLDRCVVVTLTAQDWDWLDRMAGVAGSTRRALVSSLLRELVRELVRDDMAEERRPVTESRPRA